MTQAKQRSASAAPWWSAIHSGLALVGVVAIVSLGMKHVAPDTLRAGLSDRGVAKQVVADVVPEAEEALAPAVHVAPNPRARAIAGYVARNYRIAASAAENLVTTAFRVAEETALDPLLLVAVMAIESRFNPIAASDMGAKGLMQVIPKYHLEKLDLHGGEDRVLDPDVNIHVGAKILKEYILRSGEVESGLQWYNGAAADLTRGYADKVLDEYDRLARLVGKSRMPRSPRPATVVVPPAMITG